MKRIPRVGEVWMMWDVKDCYLVLSKKRESTSEFYYMYECVNLSNDSSFGQIFYYYYSSKTKNSDIRIA
jgi:hypothetical protein